MIICKSALHFKHMVVLDIEREAKIHLEDGKKQANIVGLRRVSINAVGDLFKLIWP